MKAIIMAGGVGSRLRPLTCCIPKPMVPLLNVPVIDYGIRLLKKHGIEDITATLQYLPNVIKDHIKDGAAFGVRMRYSLEEEPLGTAGSVLQAMHGEKEPVLVLSGDALTDADLSKAIQFHNENHSKATIILKKVDMPTEYGVVLCKSSGRIQRFLEKPMISQVFSDLANTGIYILEPDVLDLIPEGKSYDFGRDVFPKMMREDIPMYGFETDGYWCDIGDITQYMQAQFDLLEGRCAFETKAKRYANHVYVERGARVSRSTKIEGPCYLAEGVEIGANTQIGPYSVLCDGVRVGEQCSVKRSILMTDSKVRNGVQIRGAVLCDHACMDAHASAFEGAVLGTRSTLGQNATLASGVLIWPEKHLEPNMRFDDNIVWGDTRQDVFTDAGVSAHTDRALSPEKAVRLGAAFANTLKGGRQLVLATDGSSLAVMIKQAVAAGCLSQGADVLELSHSVLPVFRYAIRKLGAQGGIYLHAIQNDPYGVDAILYDASGIPIDSPQLRKTRETFQRGEIAPVTDQELGVIESYSGMERIYVTDCLSRLDVYVMKSKPASILLYAQPKLRDIIALLLMQCGWQCTYATSSDADAFSKELLEHKAAFGCIIDDSGVLTLIDGQGKFRTQHECIALLAWIISKKRNVRSMVFNVSMPKAYLSFFEQAGLDVAIAPESEKEWMRAAQTADVMLEEFFDPVMVCLRLCEGHASFNLQLLLDKLPDVALKENSIPCTWREVGRVLRQLVETEQSDALELIDGVKVTKTDGWVLVQPEKHKPGLRIIVSSAREEYAEELSRIYLDKLKKTLDQNRK